MGADEIEKRIIKDITMYYETYAWPFPVDQLRRSYDYATKKLGHGNFNDYIEHLAAKEVLYLTCTPSFKKVVMLSSEAKRLEEAGTLMAVIMEYDKNKLAKKSRARELKDVTNG